MRAVKKTISIPQELIIEVYSVSDNFSQIVTIALQEYIKHIKLQKAIESFGKWEQRSEDSITIVNKLRKDRGRKYADRTH